MTVVRINFSAAKAKIIEKFRFVKLQENFERKIEQIFGGGEATISRDH